MREWKAAQQCGLGRVGVRVEPLQAFWAVITLFTSLQQNLLCIHSFSVAVLFPQKKVVEQLRRDLLVKQDSAEIRLQTHTQLPLQADGKTTTLVSNQNQSSLPPAHLNTPQVVVSPSLLLYVETCVLSLQNF